MKNDKKSLKWNGEMEEWLKDFFLDPLTTYLDETEFRMDVFETENDYIVEALLPNFHKKNISVIAEHDYITIHASTTINSLVEKKQRTIFFPFFIDIKEITAAFNNDILEIFVSKHSLSTRKTNTISIQ